MASRFPRFVAARALLGTLFRVARLRLPSATGKQWARRTVGLLLAVVVIGLALVWSSLEGRRKAASLHQALNEAFRRLDEGDYAGARNLATALRSANLTFMEISGPVFILASVLAHEADEQDDPAKRRDLYVIASRYFEESRDRGFPPSREAEGTYQLARTLYLGGRYTDSIPALQVAAKLKPDRMTPLHYYLANAYLRSEPWQPDEVLAALQVFLADPQLTPLEQLEGLWVRAQVLFREGDRQGCRDSLRRIAEATAVAGAPAEAGPRKGPGRKDHAAAQRTNEVRQEAAILEARLLMAEAAAVPAEAPTYYQQARDILRALQERDQAAPDGEYLLGLTYLRLGDAQAAGEQFVRTIARCFGTPAARAAQFEQAELLQGLGKYDAAHQAFLAALREAAAGPNPWLDEQRLRAGALAAYHSALDNQRFPQALALADALPPWISREQALSLRANAHLAWAEQFLQQGEQSAPAEALASRKLAWQHFRAAGQTFAELSRLQFTSRHYTSHLWRSAELFLRGNDYRAALRQVNEYLRQEPKRLRPQALVLRGTAQLGLGRAEDALQSFEQCLATYVADPQCYRARLGAAQACLELGRLAAARQFLEANLDDDLLTPRSLDWRDSVFLLGETLHRQGMSLLTQDPADGATTAAAGGSATAAAPKPEQAAEILGAAILRLTEAVQRFPQDGRALRTRYLIAEDYRYRAEVPKSQLSREPIESRRAALRRQVRADLESAFDNYSQLLVDLERQQDQRPLASLEAAIQRNSYFARALSLFRLERIPEALDAYRTATNRYQKDPVSLEAYQQIAACYRQLGDAAKVRGTLEQAKIVMQDMPQNVDYSQTTRYPRDVWVNILQ